MKSVSEISSEFCEVLHSVNLRPETRTQNLNAVQFVCQLLQRHAPVSPLT